MRDTIVFDTPNQAFYENRVFDPDNAIKYPGAMVAVKLNELATSAGYNVVTCDLVDSQGIYPQQTILWTEQWSPYTAGLILRGALPAIVFSAETLWHAWSFYSRLYGISSLYSHVFLFQGVQRHVNFRKAVFHRAYFPQSLKKRLFQKESWDARQLLVMINSNMKPPGGWKYKLSCMKEPSLKNDLYKERLRAIEFFSCKQGFDLYGRGWSKSSPWLSDVEMGAVQCCFKGECNDKVETLSRYRFAICFENTIFEGYITEKIFDCFFAGCIPIYYGAPDINQYIPEGTFIDMRNFNNYEELFSFLSGMTEAQTSKYIDAIDDFLASESFQPFLCENVACSYLEAIKECTSGTSCTHSLNLPAVIGLKTVQAKEYLKSCVRNLLVGHS